jgi:hypothetical protein
MAKKISGGRGRIRILYADVEGDDETILNSINALNSVVSKASQPRLARQGAPQRQATLPFAEDDEVDVAEENGEVDENVVDAVVPERKKGKRKLPQMTPVKDLDLRPEGQKTLREFYTEKSPESQTEQVTVFVYYLQHIATVPKINACHVYTCYKDVGVRSPNDLPQIIRNTGNSKKGWIDCSDADNLKVTNLGETLVEHDLPASSAVPK